LSSQPQDRSLRLKLCGALTLLFGVVLASLGALQVAVALLGLLPVATDAATLATGTLAYGLIGALFGGVGLGSLRLRRWALPTMQTLAWSWLLLGLFSSVMMWSMLDGLLALSPTTAGAPAEALLLVRLVAWLAILLGGMLTPACLIWIYRSPDVRWTLEQHDPQPSWTDRCPSPVLGMAIGLAAAGVVTLPTAFKPALPLFGRVLTGPGGTLLTLSAALLCFWLARELFHLRRSGWWGTLIGLTLVGISTSWTLWWGDTQQLLIAAGYPADFVIPENFASLGALLSLAITVATWLYMLRLRQHFDGR